MQNNPLHVYAGMDSLYHTAGYTHWVHTFTISLSMGKVFFYQTLTLLGKNPQSRWDKDDMVR